MFIIKVLDSNLDRFKEYSVLSIRIALGVVFLTHGSQKLFGFFGGGGIAGTIRFMDMMGFDFAAFFGIALSCAEFFGGLLTLLGLFTRWAALFIAIVMSVAVFTVHLKYGFFVSNKGFEFAGSLLCMAIALIINGGGKISLDNLLFNKN
jgi:putative oxidoreductase